ncbi:5-oxoprolinase subunit PxpB [Neobacillus sp. SAB-20_R2A]|uniref:5-oxoprolinase subunit PxpB n=1 Tax=Neobacillus sp. SAB-20_R2A TaxID=3120519 RepID=UPI003C6E55B4
MSNTKVFFPRVNITGERSIRFAFSNQVGKEIFNQVQSFCHMLEKESFFIEEVVPSYHTVTVYLKKDLEKKEPFIQSLLAKWEHQSKGKPDWNPRKLQIPVCYNVEFALDMERVMGHTGLRDSEIISLHSQTVYTTYMIGFLPGFPYLGELNPKLATPRLPNPRAKVPKGTVGIGGSQTGIYPIECPGGWNIIGKTPLEIYRPDREEPFFIRTGDTLQFTAISQTEFSAIQVQLAKHPESISEFIVEN